MTAMSATCCRCGEAVAIVITLPHGRSMCRPCWGTLGKGDIQAALPRADGDGGGAHWEAKPSLSGEQTHREAQLAWAARRLKEDHHPDWELEKCRRYLAGQWWLAASVAAPEGLDWTEACLLMHGVR